MKNIKTESEIISRWEGGIKIPLVSICCITYNHQEYIEEAIRGFLIQETDFTFEILIYDDASTDCTPDIIKKYESSYPRLIKAIYQRENQYSRGVKNNPVYNFTRSMGKYIAICEGDDYWLNPHKLQLQVNLMTQHEDIGISFHPVYKVDRDDLIADEFYGNHGRTLRVYSPETIIRSDGGFMPTASLMLRTELVRHMPSWFHEFAPVGDYYIQVLCSIPSGALFLPDIMAAYRVNIKGSWTSKYQNKESRKQWVLKDHKAMMAMNRYLDYLYERSLKYLFCKRVFTVLKSPSFPVAEKLDIYNEVSSFLMPLCRVYVGLTAVFSNIILIPARKLKSIIKSHCGIRIFL